VNLTRWPSPKAAKIVLPSNTRGEFSSASSTVSLFSRVVLTPLMLPSYHVYGDLQQALSAKYRLVSIAIMGNGLSSAPCASECEVAGMKNIEHAGCPMLDGSIHSTKKAASDAARAPCAEVMSSSYCRIHYGCTALLSFFQARWRAWAGSVRRLGG
jgi:hypothetical protein